MKTLFKIFGFSLILTLILISNLSTVGCSSKTSTAMLDSSSIFKHELSFYKGKPLEVLLGDVDAKLNRHTYSTEPPGRLSGVYLVFENNVTIQVSFSSFKYVSPLSETNDWDFELVKKEVVSDLELIR